MYKLKFSRYRSKHCRIAYMIFGGCTLAIALCASVGIPIAISLTNANKESNAITTTTPVPLGTQGSSLIIVSSVFNFYASS
jgi:hypothetical protein